jgi:hypothetical protein
MYYWWFLCFYVFQLHRKWISVLYFKNISKICFFFVQIKRIHYTMHIALCHNYFLIKFIYIKVISTCYFIENESHEYANIHLTCENKHNEVILILFMICNLLFISLFFLNFKNHELYKFVWFFLITCGLSMELFIAHLLKAFGTSHPYKFRRY